MATNDSIQTLIHSLTPAKDQVCAFAQVTLQCQASSVVPIWLQEFSSSEERKRLSLLFVMNEVILRTAQSTDMQYLQAFAEVLEPTIEALMREKQDKLMEELRKMVLVWEDNRIFSLQFSTDLRTKLLIAINTVLDERSGAHLVQTFPVTRLLREIEQAGEALEPIDQKVKGLSQFLSQPRKCKFHSDPGKMKEMCCNLKAYREQCERQLAAHITAIMLLTKELQAQYALYSGQSNSFSLP